MNWFDVGGQLFKVAKSTTVRSDMLLMLISRQENQGTREAPVEIDFDPIIFRHVLNVMRHGDQYQMPKNYLFALPYFQVDYERAASDEEKKYTAQIIDDRLFEKMLNEPKPCCGSSCSMGGILQLISHGHREYIISKNVHRPTQEIGVGSSIVVGKITNRHIQYNIPHSGESVSSVQLRLQRRLSEEPECSMADALGHVSIFSNSNRLFYLSGSAICQIIELEEGFDHMERLRNMWKRTGVLLVNLPALMLKGTQSILTPKGISHQTTTAESTCPAKESFFEASILTHHNIIDENICLVACEFSIQVDAGFDLVSASAHLGYVFYGIPFRKKLEADRQHLMLHSCAERSKWSSLSTLHRMRLRTNGLAFAMTIRAITPNNVDTPHLKNLRLNLNNNPWRIWDSIDLMLLRQKGGFYYIEIPGFINFARIDYVEVAAEKWMHDSITALEVNLLNLNVLRYQGKTCSVIFADH